MHNHDATPMHFRFAMPHEAERIRAIEYDAAQRFVDVDMAGIATARPMDVEFVQRKIAASEIVVAVPGDADCVGFAMFVRMKADFYLEELDVLGAWAGRRIGAALIERVAELARAAAARRLVLSTYRDVPWNAPYYRRLGFSVIPEASLDERLRALRAAHVARGLDESKRVFMWREVGATPL
jgi:predicted N-acetyltransferase YhbS